MERREEIALIRKIISKDERAFRQFYELFFPKVYRYAYRKLQNREQAEDITSETFLKVLKSLGNYESRMSGGLDIWIYSIERNCIRDWFRKNAGVEVLPLEEKWGDVLNPLIEDPYVLMERREIEKTVDEALEEIPGQYRELIELRFFKKKRIKEIAAMLGKNEGAVKVMQFRALNALKEKIKEKMESGK